MLNWQTVECKSSDFNIFGIFGQKLRLQNAFALQGSNMLYPNMEFQIRWQNRKSVLLTHWYSEIFYKNKRFVPIIHYYSNQGLLIHLLNSLKFGQHSVFFHKKKNIENRLKYILHSKSVSYTYLTLSKKDNRFVCAPGPFWLSIQIV